jgi:nitrite reductase/ring-hydroxylating ferredoxin subunit/multimeric flavodoxin WrbA
MPEDVWVDLGSVEELRRKDLAQVRVGHTAIALTYRNGEFSAISGACNHVGGPLGDGTLDGDYVVCPWHHYKFHFRTGEGEPGYEADAVPRYDVKIDGERLFVNLNAATRRSKIPHPPHPLERPIERAPGRTRVLGISTTAMDVAYPRYSTSDALLQTALAHAAGALDADTRLIRLTELAFRNCEGYYSKSAHACTWPCSITQMDPADQMDQVYEGIVFWADVILVSTPIRWGSASALYFKMVERMNCVQNQITLRDRVMVRNKVASFIITGGQDNIQAVAGEMLGFFAEIGCLFPQFPYIAIPAVVGRGHGKQHFVCAEEQGPREAPGAHRARGRALSDDRRRVHGTEKVMRAGRKADGLDRAAMGSEQLRAMEDGE